MKLLVVDHLLSGDFGPSSWVQLSLMLTDGMPFLYSRSVCNCVADSCICFKALMCVVVVLLGISLSKSKSKGALYRTSSSKADEYENSLQEVRRRRITVNFTEQAKSARGHRSRPAFTGNLESLVDILNS